LASSAITDRSSVSTSGLTSNSVASHSTKPSYSFCRNAATSSRIDSSKPAWAAMSVAAASSSPLVGSTSTLTTFSGVRRLTSSISTPPSTDAMTL
jgi:hypothetical protein